MRLSTIGLVRLRGWGAGVREGMYMREERGRVVYGIGRSQGRWSPRKIFPDPARVALHVDPCLTAQEQWDRYDKATVNDVCVPI